MESALNPREIQTRIRSGASIEQVAAECGVPASQVEPFATPVLAERQHQALSALQSPVRRRGETGSNRTLRTVVSESLLSQGIDADTVDWDAWRTDDRLWIVVGRYPTPGARADATAGSDASGAEAPGAEDADAAPVQEPQWRFDPRARYSTAVNDQARALIGEADFAVPARRRPGFRGDFEPTVDLTDERALLRASQDAAEMTIPLPSSSRPRDENLVAPEPSPANYDELAARQGNVSPHGVRQHGEGEVGGPREVRPQPTGERIQHNPETGPQSPAPAGVPDAGMGNGPDLAAHVTQPETPQQATPDRDAPEALDEQPRAHYLQPEQVETTDAGAVAPYPGAATPDAVGRPDAEHQDDSRQDDSHQIEADDRDAGDPYVDTELEQVDGVYDFVPSHTASLDSLYDMLQGFNEDSVNIYEGLDRLPPMVARDDASDATAPSEAEVAGVGIAGVEVEGIEFGVPRADDAPSAGPTAPGGYAVERVEVTRVEVSHPDAGHPDATRVDVTDVELLGIEVTEQNLEALQHPHDEPAPQDVAHAGSRPKADPFAPAGDAAPEPVGTAAARSVPLGVPSQQDAAPSAAGAPGSDVVDAEAVATGWPASMGTEREPQTTLENPVDHAVNDTARAAAEPSSSPDLRPAVPEPAPVQPAPAATIPASTAPAPAASAPAPEVAPQQPAAPENEETKAIAPRPRRRKRAAVPSWDEIMFGGPGRSDI